MTQIALATLHIRITVTLPDAPTLSGTPIDDVTFATDSGIQTVDASVAFTAGAGVFSITDNPDPLIISIDPNTGILSLDTEGVIPITVSHDIVVTKTNSGGTVSATEFTITLDDDAPVVSGLTFDPDGDPNPTLAFNVNRVGPLTAVVNNTASPTPEAVIAQHTTPGSETWASAQFTAVAGPNSHPLDISGVPDGEWWLHVVLPDAFGRYGIASAQFERTGSVADVTTLVPLGDGTISVTSLAAITALTATPLGDGTLEIANA